MITAIVSQTQMNPTTLKSWLLRGELEKLEHVVLEGRGARLLGEHSPDLRTRVFLKGLPNYLVGISLITRFAKAGHSRSSQEIVTFLSDKNLVRA